MVRVGTLPSSTIPPLMNNQRETISDQLYHCLLNRWKLRWQAKKCPNHHHYYHCHNHIFSVKSCRPSPSWIEHQGFSTIYIFWRGVKELKITIGTAAQTNKERSNNICNQVFLPCKIASSAQRWITKAKGFQSFFSLQDGKSNKICVTFQDIWSGKSCSSWKWPNPQILSERKKDKGLSPILLGKKW